MYYIYIYIYIYVYIYIHMYIYIYTVVKQCTTSNTPSQKSSQIGAMNYPQIVGL